MLLQDLHELARRAHNWTSFVPDERADQYIKTYSQELENDLQRLKAIGEKYQVPDAAIKDLQDRYTERYRRHFSAWMVAKSGCMSVMITGPAKFPVRKAEKANNAERAKSTFFSEWRGRFMKAIERQYKPKPTVSSDLDAAKTKLAHLEQKQILMKEVNKVIRKAKGNDCTADIIKLGLTKSIAKDLQSDEGRWWGKGFAGFELTNNNAEIKRLKDRIIVLSQKEEKQQAGEAPETVINGVKVVQNFEADRVQLHFDGKPSSETIQKLKKAAFKWSPKAGVWQRKITNNAVQAAIYLLKNLNS